MSDNRGDLPPPPSYEEAQAMAGGSQPSAPPQPTDGTEPFKLYNYEKGSTATVPHAGPPPAYPPAQNVGFNQPPQSGYPAAPAGGYGPPPGPGQGMQPGYPPQGYQAGQPGQYPYQQAYGSAAGQPVLVHQTQFASGQQNVSSLGYNTTPQAMGMRNQNVGARRTVSLVVSVIFIIIVIIIIVSTTNFI